MSQDNMPGEENESVLNAPAPEAEIQTQEANAQAAPQEAPAEAEVLRGELEAARKELADVKDQLLRKAADFDNYRKRMMKEKEEAQKFANSTLLSDLVQVLDDFERAIRSSEQARDYDSFHSGIIMIEGQFASMLERKYGLKRFESLGKPFTPDFHEAIAMASPEGDHEVVVIEEYQKGYQLHDRVIRTAKVRVGKNENTEQQKQESVKAEGE